MYINIIKIFLKPVQSFRPRGRGAIYTVPIRFLALVKTAEHPTCYVRKQVTKKSKYT